MGNNIECYNIRLDRNFTTMIPLKRIYKNPARFSPQPHRIFSLLPYSISFPLSIPPQRLLSIVRLRIMLHSQVILLDRNIQIMLWKIPFPHRDPFLVMFRMSGNWKLRQILSIDTPNVRVQP